MSVNARWAFTLNFARVFRHAAKHTVLLKQSICYQTMYVRVRSLMIGLPDMNTSRCNTIAVNPDDPVLLIYSYVELHIRITMCSK